MTRNKLLRYTFFRRYIYPGRTLPYLTTNIGGKKALSHDIYGTVKYKSYNRVRQKLGA